jgi:hypothetical protein
MMSTVPCPELDSLRLDYELTLRAGAEIGFSLVGWVNRDNGTSHDCSVQIRGSH